MADNLMGFKKVDRRISRKNHSIYDPLIDEVLKRGGMYANDVQDSRRATMLANTLRSVLKKRNVTNVKVSKIEMTVCIERID